MLILHLLRYRNVFLCKLFCLDFWFQLSLREPNLYLDNVLNHLLIHIGASIYYLIHLILWWFLQIHYGALFYKNLFTNKCLKITKPYLPFIYLTFLGLILRSVYYNSMIVLVRFMAHKHLSYIKKIKLHYFSVWFWYINRIKYFEICIIAHYDF